MFLSVIIPVYNAVDTIERCLNSIWSQDIPANDYEVICVDDCSTDGSLDILRQSEFHPELRVLRNSTNLRAGGARNHGVREARGEYIVFVDADDYYHHGALKKAYEYQKQNRLDILVCDCARHHQDRPNDIMIHNFRSKDVMTGRRFMVVNTLPYAPWKYIFRRDLMVDNHVWFAEKVSCEDVDWSHKMALFAKAMQYQPLLLVHYILSENSQTGAEYKRPATVFYRMMAGQRLMELLPLCSNSDERKQIVAVARETLANGVVFMCALLSSPSGKCRIIKQCVDYDTDWGRLLNIVKRIPFTYSIFSTLIAPVFRTAIYIKRNLKGR